MSVYTKVDSGTKLYRSRVNKSYSHQFTCGFGKPIPAMARFVLPGDVVKMGARVLIRYQPTLAPILSRAKAKMRYFFVPLRLLYPDICEQVITGSADGKEISGEIPVFPNFLNNIASTKSCEVKKYSFWDYLGIQKGVAFNTLTDTDKSFLPAEYWYKAFCRIWWDYFRDENITTYKDFDSYFSLNQNGAYGFDKTGIDSLYLRKDYFTSSLPWQMKGPVPTFTVQQSLDFSDAMAAKTGIAIPNGYAVGNMSNVASWNSGLASGVVSSASGLEGKVVFDAGGTQDLLDTLNRIKISSSSFDVSDLRSIFAQTRVFERLARCGSRYTEYLRANFNTSPDDGTLQRAVYLGGFTQPVVTTEIAQTAADGDNAVGTLRGKGISDSGGFASPYFVKEFGVIFGIFSVMPEVNYTQGIDREYTYKERFDFFNPSFQNLSEQEVRNAELYVATDGKNGDTFGFQGYFNELRSSRNIVTGDLVDTLAYWTQSISFTKRPNLNQSFLSAGSYDNANNFRRPFAVPSEMPVIVDCHNILDFYRPMVKNPVPGLIDHN